MPNVKSAKKRVKVIAAKTLQNKSARSELKTAIKKAELALTNNTGDKTEVVRAAIKKIDSAASDGILHKNNAARKKSGLQLRLNRA